MYRNCLRYGLLAVVLLFAWLFLLPGIEELHTLLIIVMIEVIAVGLSALAVYSYTKIDFTHELETNNLGHIFMGVHICVGLSVLGVYLVQFS